MKQGRRGGRPRDHAHGAAGAARLFLLAVAGLWALGSLAGPASASPAGNRAWELVTPPAPVTATINDVIAVRDDGLRLLFTSVGSLPGAPSGDVMAHNFAVRTAEGWRTESIGGSYEIGRVGAGFTGPKVAAVDAAFSSAILTHPLPMLPSAPPSPRVGVYRWNEGDLALLADAAPLGSVSGASSDLARVAFRSTAHLLPSDAGRSQGGSIYLWDKGVLRQVDLDSAGGLLSACGSAVPPGGVSSSGDRIFFVHPSPSGACGAHSQIYLRESDGVTTSVSGSRCDDGACGPAQPAGFAGATPSGSSAFLTSEGRLTNADQNAQRDLYRFTAATGVLQLVSPGSADQGGSVLGGLALASADGSIVYFYADDRLLSDEDATGTNLYVASGGEVRRIAAVDPLATPLDITGDGRFAVLSTTRSLAAADTDESVDTYLYDEEAGELSLISQAAMAGNGPFDASIESPLRTFVATLSPIRNAIADDGSRIFFGTAERLLPEDGNEALDVYEWHAGRLGLLSAGGGDAAAKFAAATPDGRHVVIATARTLLPSDRDGGDLDLYMAREGGGFDEGGQAPCEGCDPIDPGLTPPRLAPASATVRAARKGKLGLRPVGRGACRSLVSRSRVEITVLAPEPGRVVAVIGARAGGRSRELMRGTAGAVAPGALTVSLEAPRAARRELLERRRILTRLVVRQGSRTLGRRVEFRCGAVR